MTVRDLPTALIDGLGVRAATPVTGGDIALAYRLDTDSGPLFAKTSASPTPDLFEREAAGLAALRAHAPAELGVPEVVRSDASGLVLEWIDQGHATGHTERDLGRGLAALHRTTNPTFGGLDGALAGYLGPPRSTSRPPPRGPSSSSSDDCGH